MGVPICLKSFALSLLLNKQPTPPPQIEQAKVRLKAHIGSFRNENYIAVYGVKSVSLKVRPHINFHHIKTSSSFLILTFKKPHPYFEVV
jgi:hypothetical protein